MILLCFAPAPWGNLRPTAGRDGDPVRRRPDCVHALGHAAARSLHRLDAQQPQLVFRGLRPRNHSARGREAACRTGEQRNCSGSSYDSYAERNKTIVSHPL